jgi:hypothetical protein
MGFNSCFQASGKSSGWLEKHVASMLSHLKGNLAIPLLNLMLGKYI